MFGLGFGELVLILIIALIFIGPKKLPELAKGLGQGMREFQKAAKGLTEQLNEEVKSSEETQVKKQISSTEVLPPSEETKSKEEKQS